MEPSTDQYIQSAANRRLLHFLSFNKIELYLTAWQYGRVLFAVGALGRIQVEWFPAETWHRRCSRRSARSLCSSSSSSCCYSAASSHCVEAVVCAKRNSVSADQSCAYELLCVIVHSLCGMFPSCYELEPQGRTRSVAVPLVKRQGAAR